MIFSKIKKYYTLFIRMGADAHTNKNELKSIQLFNGFCGMWYVLNALAVIANFDTGPLGQYLTIDIDTHLIVMSIIAMTVLLILIQFIHYKRYFYTARLLLVISIIIVNFIIANYIYKGGLTEYFFLFPPAMSLVFINSKKISYFILAISYLCFALPNFYFKHYPAEVFNDVSVPFLFFGMFIFINYFKTLNRNNERALELKTKELEDINSFQSRFFINISHEIRTPLTLLKGYIDELKMSSVSFPKATGIAEGLNGQVSKITKMVDDVIDLAKMESSDFKLNLKPVNLTELTARLYLAFEPLFQQKNIHFEFKKRNKNYLVQADSVYLERALNNIVVNALKYTDKEGAVTIELIRKQQEIMVHVSDTGIGISEADIDKICNRFYQADNDINSAGGSGIGLAFSREIVGMHRGKLRIRSTLGRGSRFIITLPLIDALPGDVPAIENTALGPVLKSSEDVFSVKNRVFLVVDDHAGMRTYLKNILYEHTCLEAENGLEALEMVKEHTIDLILTDYMMPKMNGLQLITRLKAQKNPTPVLMLTARTDKESKLTVLRLGIDDYLTKPFEKEELLIRIQNTLRNHNNRISYIKAQKLSPEETGQGPGWIQAVKNHIERESANTDLTQTGIADHFNLSLSTLYRRIKGETGLSPQEFIKEIKLQKARRITENNPGILLKQLSLEVGYAHSYHFSHIYYERFGRRPLE